MHIIRVDATFLLFPIASDIKRGKKGTMKSLHRIIFLIGIVAGLAMTASAQKGPKKPPPKERPPVVTPQPKNPPPKDDDKKPKKPSYVLVAMKVD